MGQNFDATRIDYQHFSIVKFFPLIQRHRNVGDAHSGGGGVRVVHQIHEDEKNSPEFFEAKAEPPRASQDNQMISPEQRKHIFRSHSGSPGMPELYLKNHSGFFVLFVPSKLTIINTPITNHPKPPFPSRSCAPVELFGTFAIYLRVLARILDQEEGIPSGARFGPVNLLIVPFSFEFPGFSVHRIFRPF